MKEYILAFDIGTSAVKATLVSEDMRVVAETAETYPTYTASSGVVEQCATDWWRAACMAAHCVLDNQAICSDRIACIGVSGHMLGLLPVSSSGVPLMRAMIHADTRASMQMQEISSVVGADALYNLTGNVLSPAAPLCKALWLKQTRPSIYKRTARFLQSKDYLNYCLTGDLDSTDYSDASHAMLIDIRKKEYLLDVFSELGLQAEHFPTLHSSTQIIGCLTRNAAEKLGLHSGIPVIAGGGDGACASVGAGIGNNGDVYCSLGTTGWIACNMVTPVVDEARRVFNILSLDGEHSGVFGTVQCVGKAIAWAQRLFAPEGMAAFNQMAAETEAGSNGLIFLPYLEGERSPIFDEQARGVFFGIDSTHTRRHFARAVFEGVSCALSSVLNIMREQIPISDMRVVGGGAKSILWKKILADVGHVKIWDVDVSAAAATSLGAAAAAGVAVGMYKDISTASKNIRRLCLTAPDCANEQAYSELMKRYSMLYPLLKPAFHLVD